ncbi:MAG TPA: SusC/RagA family TonB-linked outer membrane protein, partial [Bacteroidales bacterium]|nr:SusC/RagA family TonB-linked outer membrane protein [Bacteroidales bacterium]
MKKFTILFVCLLLMGFSSLLGQEIQVTGTVTDKTDGGPLPGVSVVVKGTVTGTATDVSGKYSITVPSDASLIFSSIGMKTQDIPVNGRTEINVLMEQEIGELDEVVVTALGVSRAKKSLGYSVQEVDGDQLNTVKSDNFINALSGKAAGVNIRSTGNLGGSTNVTIRGSRSLYGSNQALFVIDGVPINNANTNNDGQVSGRSGYDFGNSASDINPNDIASISILKGAAATALYGERASNGVIMITTKKGSVTPGKLIGVTLNSNVTFGTIDKSTFPTYQKKYGAGYGPYYGDAPYTGLESIDINDDGVDELVVPMYEDASYGQAYDPSLMVYHYDAFYPESPYYGQARPWIMAKNDPTTFFETAVSYTNSIDVSGGNEKSTFRLGYTNLSQTGVMPNSKLDRNNVSLNGSYNLVKNLKVSASANYINESAKGRNSTGYSDNILSSFRQWYELNVDVQEQKDLYDNTGKNMSWNRTAWDDGTPIYWDNPYWVRYENYESDGRDRLIGYTQLDWTATSWLSFMGRFSVDSYNTLQEERKAVGSVAGELGVDRPDVTSGYSRFSRVFAETNLDMMANINKSFGENLTLTAFIGTNIRRTRLDQVFESTNGGLSVPEVYALSNSANPMLPPEEDLQRVGVNGYFGSVSLDFKGLIFLDGTFRRDISSTLPKDNWGYNYPSISTSFLFSELVDASWLSFGKLRLSYAEVGSGAPWGSVDDTYRPYAPFAGNPLVSVDNTKNNQDLKPERTKSIEGGLAMNFLKSRVGFDLSLYQTNTVDLITPVAVSYATGYSSKYLNAGEMENKGIELTLNLTPVRMSGFVWDISFNWARNMNKVKSLALGLENLRINPISLQGGVSVNARVGEPYGAIQGSDFVYEETTGRPIVRSNGYYELTGTSDIVLGTIQPDWTGGILNTFAYKNISLRALIDIQHGGSIFSLDQWYGQGTGLYPETVFINDLGNQVRNANDADGGGGLILDGVTEDGTQNTTRIEGNDYRYAGWARNPNSAFIYDASYVKLRELSLTYDLPIKILSNTPIYGASLSLVGS